MQRDPRAAAVHRDMEREISALPQQAQSWPRFPLWQLSPGRVASPYPLSNLAKETWRFSRGELQSGNDQGSKDLLSLEACFLLNVFAQGRKTPCSDSWDFFENKQPPSVSYLGSYHR